MPLGFMPKLFVYVRQFILFAVPEGESSIVYIRFSIDFTIQAFVDSLLLAFVEKIVR